MVLLKELFATAVNAIVKSHKSLYDQLWTAFECYNNSRTLPPRANRVSRILDCEANGAHALIENLATAAKASGQNKGYSSAKVLADAYKKSE